MPCGAPDGRDDAGPSMRELDASETHAAGRAGDEHRFAGLDLRAVDERVTGCEIHVQQR